MTDGTQGPHSHRRIRKPDPMLGRTRPSMRPVGPGGRVPGTPAHAKHARPKPKRQRVVLDYGAPAAAGRATLQGRAELAQQTSWGEMLIKDLIGALLRSGALLTLIGVAVLVGLPLLMWLTPDFTQLTVVGLPVVWLLLGIVPFPLMAGLGFAFVRSADRHEQAFVDMIEH